MVRCQGVIFVMLLILQMPASAESKSLARTFSCELLLYNGKILTMDRNATVATSVGINNGLIEFVGDNKSKKQACLKQINLHGKTVIPGLIDSHIHFLRDANLPGHDVRLVETAFSFSDLKSVLIAAAAKTPKGEFLTVIGGFNRQQFKEKRMPTAQELDEVTPYHPVYLQEGFSGLASANSLAMALFRKHELFYPKDGVISSRLFDESVAAIGATHNFARTVRSTWRLMHDASVWGLTTIVDQGGPPDSYNPETHYDPVLVLWRRHDMPIRIRLSFLTYDTADTFALEQRLANNYMGFGDDMLKVAGVGEHIIRYPGFFFRAPEDGGELLKKKMLSIASKGWAFTQHSSSLAQNKIHTAKMAEVAEQYPLADLRWSIAHASNIEEQQLKVLKRIGVGVTVQNHSYLSGSKPNAGPPYRRILRAGVKAGGGTDARGVSPMNPWLSIYYMVTGKNSAGKLINQGETISRMEALRLYTIENAWFLKEDQQLGSVEAGKRADLVVLDADYLTVAADDIRKLKSVLTLVGGSIVYIDENQGIRLAEGRSNN